jgi:lipopolysaccharide export system protein LptA
MKKLFIFSIFFFSTTLFSDVVDIKANHFYANNINKVAFFEGNAEIKQGNNEFKSDKITVYFNKKRKAVKYEAKGKVRFDLTENGIHYTGKSNKVIYNPNSSKYLFYGRVHLVDHTNNRTIKAESIVLDLKTGLADIKGAKKQPVHFRFEIEDRK